MKKLWTGLQNLVTLKLIFSDNSDAGKQTHAETRQCHYLGYVDGRMVDEHSVLYLQVSAVEAQDSFRLKVASDVGNDFLTSDSEQKLFSHWSDSTEEQKEALRNAIARRVLATFQRETQVLHVKEGLRQAVLRPHEPFYANQLV